MGYLSIRRRYEAERSKLYNQLDKECIEEVQKLLGKLRNFHIRKVTCGCGSWSITMDPIDIVYDDGSTDSSINVDYDIIPWLEGRKIWDPVKYLASEVTILTQLRDLLDWWTNETGGCDVQIRKG